MTIPGFCEIQLLAPLLPPAPPSAGDSGDRATTTHPECPGAEIPLSPRPLRASPARGSLEYQETEGKVLDESWGWNPAGGGGTAMSIPGPGAAPAGLSRIPPAPGAAPGAAPSRPEDPPLPEAGAVLMKPVMERGSVKGILMDLPSLIRIGARKGLLWGPPLTGR